MTTIRPRLAPFHLVALVAALALPVAASAQSSSGLKVGVFDKQRIVDESKLGAGAKTKFEKLQADKEAELNTKQKEVETLRDQLQQKSSVLSDDKKGDIERDLAHKQDDLNAAAQTADHDLQRAYNQSLGDIVTKIDQVVADFGKAEAFDLLIDKDQVAYFRAGMDVTDALLAKVNAAYPQPAP